MRARVILARDTQERFEGRLAGTRGAGFVEITQYEQQYLPKSALKQGVYYRGASPDIPIARWNANEQCFYYAGQRFIETIKHRDDDMNRFFDALEETAAPVKEIAFREP